MQERERHKLPSLEVNLARRLWLPADGYLLHTYDAMRKRQLRMRALLPKFDRTRTERNTHLNGCLGVVCNVWNSISGPIFRVDAPFNAVVYASLYRKITMMSSSAEGSSGA